MPRQTYHAKPGEIEASWHLFDAEGRILGRFATEIATILMGKHRPTYTPHVLSGDFVIVTNASKIVMTGNKLDDKSLRRYSGYPGGQNVESYRTVLEKDPCRVVREAIHRMLPADASADRSSRGSRCTPDPTIPTRPSSLRPSRSPDPRTLAGFPPKPLPLLGRPSR